MIWDLIARFVSRPRIAWWLVRRSQRTPYTPILSKDGRDVYMQRWWLFNPYGRGEDGHQGPARFPWLPSIRVHHILRPDLDRHLHDHPWNARTIILAGWYVEEREPAPGSSLLRDVFRRDKGYTGRLLFGQYHRISRVSPGGVYTVFITWRYRGTWGFLVDGQKVPYREYLAQHEGQQ